jgi:hypothetical protein
MKKFSSLLVIFFLKILLNPSFAQNSLLSIFNNLDTATSGMPWINYLNPKNGEAKSGKLFAVADETNPYGLGFKGEIPDNCKDKNLHIVIREFVRANRPLQELELVVTISSGDSMIIYDSKNIASQIKNLNSWNEIIHEFDLPSTFTGSDKTLAIYLWDKEGIPVDIDDLTIDFEEKKFPTYLPRGFKKNISNIGLEKIAANESYLFYYSKEDGRLVINGIKGDTIFNTFAIYSEWLNVNDSKPNQAWNEHLYFKKESKSEDGISLLFTAHDEITESEINIIAGNDGSLKFKFNSIFKIPINLVRESFLTSFNLPVKEVFKKNSISESILKPEYWLDKEGFLISDNKTALTLYRPENVSSIQLNVLEKYAVINIDYSADHPFLHFPLLNSSQGKYIDYSTSIYKKGDEINSSFTFYKVKPEIKIPQILPNPYGFLSCFIWTEHADYTNMRTHKAVYYGKENIERLEEATGGFLKYSIPVTKSIFYSNPDKVDNIDKSGMMPGPVANYKETEGFANFLKQLYEYGIEICLHTPDHFTCNRNLLGEALEATKRPFFPVTWIDHGYDNSIKSNREDLACDGADEKSENYSADLWEKYGIKYFWNSFYEDSGIYKNYSFNSFFSVPYAGWDDAMPTPETWKNKTRTGDIVHWKTTGTIDPPDTSLWNYYFNDQRLNDAVNNRTNVIIHCYPARVDSTNGFYYSKDGLIVATDEFNSALKKLSQYRTEKKIRLTTIREFMNYKELLNGIKFEITDGSKIKISNTGKEIVRGLTFSAHAKSIEAGNKEISKKIYNDELIFWFDIYPGENLFLTLN